MTPASYHLSVRVPREMLDRLCGVAHDTDQRRAEVHRVALELGLGVLEQALAEHEPDDDERVTTT